MFVFPQSSCLRAGVSAPVNSFRETSVEWWLSGVVFWAYVRNFKCGVLSKLHNSPRYGWSSLLAILEVRELRSQGLQSPKSLLESREGSEC